MLSENARVHVIIYGRVQGVFFRLETQRAAIERGVYGWVRNLSDGTVEAVFEGAKVDVQNTLDWCYKGPPAARVDKIDATWLSAEGNLTGFEVRY